MLSRVRHGRATAIPRKNKGWLVFLRHFFMKPGSAIFRGPIAGLARKLAQLQARSHSSFCHCGVKCSGKRLHAPLQTFFFIRVVWARDSKCCRFSCDISLFVYFVWMVVLLWFLVFLVIIKFGIACFWTFFFIFHILVGYPWCLLLNYDFFLNL